MKLTWKEYPIIWTESAIHIDGTESVIREEKYSANSYDHEKAIFNMMIDDYLYLISAFCHDLEFDPIDRFIKYIDCDGNNMIIRYQKGAV